MLNTCLLIATAVGALGTLVGAWLIFRTLRADHDWRRREHAIEMLCQWNDCTADHAKAIEEVFPHIRDADRTTGKVNELTREQAKQIYTCEPDNDRYWNIRFHIIELLNHLESITTAYSNQVADRGIILNSMQEPISVWLRILSNFLDIVAECEGYQPWQPLLDTVGEWTVKKREERKPTA